MITLGLDLLQTGLRGGQCLPTQRVREAVVVALKEGGFSGKLKLSIAFVSEQTIRKLNAEYRKKDRVTDVLSFTLTDELLAKKRCIEGEILLCFSQAERQAMRMGHGVRNELLFLIVHGTLHVIGFDHETPRDRTRMFERQTRALTRLKIDPSVDFPD